MSVDRESTVGRFRLLRPLGRGSLGVVHAAFDTASRQYVALKTLAHGSGDAAEQAEARARFVAEARTAARLEHPDIVTVRDAGENDGIAWMAMELVTGCTLGRYVHPQRLLPPALVLHFGERIARALACAHALGIVHRDIKPDNVMVDLARGRLKLMDFGIAGAADHSRTRTGVVLGTPVYMAPEQLAGASADARGDLYSLGVLLFELLTAQLPHHSTSFGEFLRQVAGETAPDVRIIAPHVDPAAAEIVARLLHKQPGSRPADASSAAEALAAARAASVRLLDVPATFVREAR